MARKSILRELKDKLLYESQYACAVCQNRGCHIHHIDGDHSNNSEDNLIVLCIAHHDEAHTKRQLSQNLDAVALRYAKSNWVSAVREKRSKTATLSGQQDVHRDDSFLSVGVTWGYINHRRVAQLARPELLEKEKRKYFDYCCRANIIDRKGVLIKPNNRNAAESYIGNSIYDWYEFGDDSRVHRVYSDFVDQISHEYSPIHLDPESWTKTRVRALVRPGHFIFVERAFYFKTVSETPDNQHRRCHTFKRKISIEFFVDTRDMFGTTSMTISFSGHQCCAALLQVKSLEETSDGWLILRCTPIALGVGFRRNEVAGSTIAI